METIFTIIAALALVVGVKAGELQYIHQDTLVYTNTPVNSNTLNAAATQTYTNELNTTFAHYHTFVQSYTTNAAVASTNTIAMQRTVDGTTWIGCGGWTNTVNANGELTFTGKWLKYRFIVTQATNTSLTISHMAE